MKQEEKNIQSRRRILDGALSQFAEHGYDGASLNSLCEQNGISKGIIYHYFKSKDELYLLCVDECFDALAACLRELAGARVGTAEERLKEYFDSRLRFFAENPRLLGIFTQAVLDPPEHLAAEIACRKDRIDALNISILTELLACGELRAGLTAADVAEDFGAYVDYFNTRFRAALRSGQDLKQVFEEHEKNAEGR